jgi:hypothetical protein
MKTDDAVRPLAQGQLWKTRFADIEILGLGKRRVHYRVTTMLGNKQVSAQISGIEAMANYLKANRAQLVAAGVLNN